MHRFCTKWNLLANNLRLDFRCFWLLAENQSKIVICETQLWLFKKKKNSLLILDPVVYDLHTSAANSDWNLAPWFACWTTTNEGNVGLKSCYVDCWQYQKIQYFTYTELLCCQNSWQVSRFFPNFLDNPGISSTGGSFWQIPQIWISSFWGFSIKTFSINSDSLG